MPQNRKSGSHGHWPIRAKLRLGFSDNPYSTYTHRIRSSLLIIRPISSRRAYRVLVGNIKPSPIL